MLYPRLLTLMLLVLLLLSILASPIAAQEAVDDLVTDIYPGECDDDFEDPTASLTQPDLPAGGTVGAPDARPVATSFTTVQLSLEDLLGDDHVIATVGEDQETVACGAIGGVPTEAGALVFELREAGDSGISGVAYLAQSGAGAGQTDISLFLAGLETAQLETCAEPTAEPTIEATAEAVQDATQEADEEVDQGATTESSEAPAEVTVAITNSAFDPDSVVIPVGGTVTWVNDDTSAAHGVVVQSEDGDVERSDVLLPNFGSYSQTFTEPGTYSVVDVFNLGNQGTVVVE